MLPARVCSLIVLVALLALASVDGAKPKRKTVRRSFGCVGSDRRCTLPVRCKCRGPFCALLGQHARRHAISETRPPCRPTSMLEVVGAGGCPGVTRNRRGQLLASASNDIPSLCRCR